MKVSGSILLPSRKTVFWTRLIILGNAENSPDSSPFLNLVRLPQHSRLPQDNLASNPASSPRQGDIQHWNRVEASPGQECHQHGGMNDFLHFADTQ